MKLGADLALRPGASRQPLFRCMPGPGLGSAYSCARHGPAPAQRPTCGVKPMPSVHHGLANVGFGIRTTSTLSDTGQVYESDPPGRP